MKNVLVIEDNDSLRQDISALLSLEGYKTSQAKNGEEGLEIIKDNSFDLILCDIMMPGVDGFEVFASLRKNALTLNIPFIFLTALASDEFINKISEFEFTAYLRKPFQAEELLRLVKKSTEK